MLPLIVRNIIENITKDNTLEYFEQVIINYKLVKVHKRRLSEVFVIDINFKTLGTKTVCVKIVKYNEKDPTSFESNKNKLIHEFKENLAAYNSFQCTAEFIIIKPIAVYPDKLALVTESFNDSVTLESMITKSLLFQNKDRLDQLISIMYSSGKLLRKYHLSREKELNENELTLKKVNNLKDYILVRLRLIDTYINERTKITSSTRNCSFFENTLKNFNLAYKNEGASCSITHGDFTPANILFNGKTLGLIDFADSTENAIYADIGSFFNYLNMLNLNKPIYKRNNIEKLKLAFHRGYSSDKKLSSKLIKLYEFRYFSTNFLTQIYEVKNNKIKSYIMKRRINRYVDFLDKYNF